MPAAAAKNFPGCGNASSGEFFLSLKAMQQVRKSKEYTAAFCLEFTMLRYRCAQFYTKIL